MTILVAGGAGQVVHEDPQDSHQALPPFVPVGGAADDFPLAGGAQ